MTLKNEFKLQKFAIFDEVVIILPGVIDYGLYIEYIDMGKKTMMALCQT